MRSTKSRSGERRLAISSAAARSAAASAQPDAHAAGVRLVHERRIDGLERDGVEREPVGQRDGLVGVARGAAVAVGDAGVEQQRARLDVAGRALQRRGGRRAGAIAGCGGGVASAATARAACSLRS